MPHMSGCRPARGSRLLGLCLIGAALALMAFAPPGQRPPGAPPPPLYYAQTGHSVRAPFLDYFLSTGGVDQYGLPRTEAYVDPDTRLLVQYFDNARLEWHPGNPAPYQVQLGLVDAQLGRQQPPLPPGRLPPADDPNCQPFAETGHSVCYAFRDYWLQHGGLDRFGYPISDYTVTDGLIVQDFQRARMEWHAAGPAPHLQLSPVGLEYYRAAGFDPARLVPVDATANPGPAVNVRGRVSVFKPFVVPGDTQVAYVFVTDGAGQPLGGVAVTLIVNAPDGQTAYTLPPTGADGISFQQFVVGAYPVGTILPLDCILTYPGQPDRLTRASFMLGY
jgi:hypothetical protein